MRCEGCGEEREAKDFFGYAKCYRCIAKMKKEQQPVKTKKKMTCQICGKELGPKRWSYCSDECSLKGKNNHSKKYWTKQVTVLKVYL